MSKRPCDDKTGGAPGDELNEIGPRIRAARLARHMTLAQLGGDDLSRSFLSLVERRKTRISLRALSLVAERLGLPMTHFLKPDATETFSSDSRPLTLTARIVRQDIEGVTLQIDLR